MLTLPPDIAKPPLCALTRATLPHAGETGWFFDLDGTLIDIADHPDGVICPPELRESLVSLLARSNGAVAIITGRSREFARHLLAIDDLAVIGLHGADFPGAEPPRPAAEIAAHMRAFAKAHHNVIFEDKGAALALHFRLAPGHHLAVMEEMTTIARLAGPEFRLRYGQMVIELAPATADKGKALASLMQTPPFSGRKPLAAGDDLTDEAMFQEANLQNGLSVKVGALRPDTQARFHLPSPARLRALLQEVSR